MAGIGLYINPPASMGVDDIIEQARTADRQGFDSVWLGDHLIDYRGGTPVPEGPPDSFTLMTAIGAVTQHVRLAWGTLNPSFRNPAHLAKMVATLDQITHGRVICTFGAGWLKPEYEAYGIPFVEDHDERIEHEREVVRLVKELWTRPAPERVTFAGKYVQAHELAFNPAPFQKPHPPIWVGGDSDATVALAAEVDGWIPLSRAEPEILRELQAGPDWPQGPFTVVRLTRMIVGETLDAVLPEAEDAYEVLRKTATIKEAPSFDEFLAREVVGSPEHCAERIHELEEAGIGYHIVSFESDDQQERAARLLLPLLKERTAALA
jgi:alkanesulfonate monooxygenase SsuD/methylene tetrahydromethanopterin reductase-like flavin-dependent oxidoreductase (luciferase family)